MEQQPESETRKNTVERLDQRQLLARHVSGDESAFAELVAEFRAPVFTYLMRCGVPHASRDDLFQDVFFKIHKAAATYNPRYPLKPWLFTIVANTVRSFYRKKKVAQYVNSEEQPDEQVSADSHAHVAARETIEWLEAAISELPLKQREVLSMSCSTNMEQKDIASALGVPVNTVKTQLRRARETLARKLAKRNAQAKREVRS